jgi:hypothetical protein
VTCSKRSRTRGKRSWGDGVWECRRWSRRLAVRLLFFEVVDRGGAGRVGRGLGEAGWDDAGLCVGPLGLRSGGPRGFRGSGGSRPILDGLPLLIFWSILLVHPRF